MNPVLARQLRRLGIDPSGAPSDREAWQALLDRVSTTYEDADRSRYLLERSLQISSEEMRALNERIRRRSMAEQARSARHYENLFDGSPIPTWEEDFTEVGRRLDELKEAGVQRLNDHLDADPAELLRLISLVRVRAANPAAAALTGARDPAELVGNMDPGEMDESSRASFRLQLQSIWDGRPMIRFEFTGQRLDGSIMHGILHWSAPRVRHRLDLSRVIVAIVDITDRKQAEVEMERLIRSKDEFLASVSHELRTPLTSVYGSALSLSEQWSQLDADMQVELVDFIAKESGDLADMVEDLLVAARADIGRIVVIPQHTDLAPEVERVVRAAGEAGGRHVDISDIRGKAYVDPLRLKQILRNLLTNALRYGGPRIRFSSQRVGSSVILTVADNGSGVDGQKRETIFRLYERAHDEATQAGSVGVGLAVSRQLARLMGGDLAYEYVDGWSRFRLDLPTEPGIEVPGA